MWAGTWVRIHRVQRYVQSTPVPRYHVHHTEYIRRTGGCHVCHASITLCSLACQPAAQPSPSPAQQSKGMQTRPRPPFEVRPCGLAALGLAYCPFRLAGCTRERAPACGQNPSVCFIIILFFCAHHPPFILFHVALTELHLNA